MKTPTKFTILLISLMMGGTFFTGCSSKTQIASEGGNYHLSQEEQAFNEEQDINRRIAAALEKGKQTGYEKAKADFEKIIPYIEAIRASAELKKSGGLCLPPLFLDKRNGSSVAIVMGKAHVCESFTVENVLKAVKSGIPGLPDYATGNTSECTGAGSFAPSSVSIAGRDSTNYFIEKPVNGSSDQKVVQVKDSYTNRQILREATVKFGSLEVGNDGYLNLHFDDEKSAREFCSAYKICEQRGKQS